MLLQAWELARELLPAVGLKSGFDRSGPKCFRIVGDELMPEDYEKVSTSPPDPKVVVGQAPSHWHPFRAKAAPLRKADKVVRLPAYTIRPATQAG